MKRNYPIRRSIRLLIMVGLSILLLATAAFAVEDQGTTVKRDPKGCDVHVILQIGVVDTTYIIMVDYVRSALKDCLENIPCEILCVRPPHCKVDVTVDVKQWGDIKPLADTIKYHKVEMVDPVPDSFSWAFRGIPNSRDYKYFQPGKRPNLAGKWARMQTGAPIEAFVWVHEALHLAGLNDEYCEDRFLLKIGGFRFLKVEYRSCPPDGGPHPCNTGLQRPDFRATRPCTGDENDIMADLANPVSSANILKIVALAGPDLNSCPEDPCCPAPTPCLKPQRIPGSSFHEHYYWGNPSPYGDNFLNQRFDMPQDLGGRLEKIEVLFYQPSSGTPDLDLYVWFSDTSGLYPLDNNPPSQAIAHFHIPYDSIVWCPSYTVVETWEQGIVFNPGEKFYIGYAHAYTPGDTLFIWSDDGAHNSNRSVEWALPGQWGTILDDWGVGVDFFINAWICPQEPYICGDCKDGGTITLADVIYLANYILKGGPPPVSNWAADVNCDGKINLVDVIILAKYILGFPGFYLNCCP